MAADYVSIEEALAQLRLQPTLPDEADVERKVSLATAIIRDYLKGRADKALTITSSSVASPTVITTSAAHAFANGDEVVIAGHTGSTPTISGEWTVSGVTELTFTIPVAVTVAGTGGTAIVSWDEDTVPYQVKAATLLMLTHLYEHRGDEMRPDEFLWKAIERLLARSRDPALA